MTRSSPVQERSVWRAVVRWAVPVAVGVALALAPVPQGLTPNAWRYFALFAAVMVGKIGRAHV